MTYQYNKLPQFQVLLEESSKNQAAFHDRLDERDRVLLDQAPSQNQAQLSPSTSTFRCEIFEFFLLSFPQNERKIY